MKRLIERNKPKEMIFKTLVQDFFLENPKVEKAIIEIKSDKATRSSKQNSLLWLYYGVIEQETGQPIKDYLEDGKWRKGLHTRFKCDFINKEFYADGSMKIPSTRKLKVQAFADFLQRIDMSMAELGIVLPHPEDIYYKAMGVKAP